MGIERWVAADIVSRGGSGCAPAMGSNRGSSHGRDSIDYGQMVNPVELRKACVLSQLVTKKRTSWQTTLLTGPKENHTMVWGEKVRPLKMKQLPVTGDES